MTIGTVGRQRKPIDSRRRPKRTHGSKPKYADYAKNWPRVEHNNHKWEVQQTQWPRQLRWQRLGSHHHQVGIYKSNDSGHFKAIG